MAVFQSACEPLGYIYKSTTQVLTVRGRGGGGKSMRTGGNDVLAGTWPVPSRQFVYISSSFFSWKSGKCTSWRGYYLGVVSAVT